MSDKTSESENRKPGRPRKYSTTEEANSGGSSSSGTPLKKGPWTSSEDAILVDYVTKHGEGNWNAVQKNTGLARCGKSCRLRWANHLRPDLKKGAFTPEEEERILELHLKYGNKWARMAAELPGRTDNEIKNYWNTRIKRLQRLGQPLYPPELHIEANENRENWDTGTSGNVETCPSNTSQTNTLEIPEVRFKYFEPNQHFLSCPPPPLPDMPCSSLLVPSRFPNNFSFPATSHPNVNPQEYDNPFRTYQYDNDPAGTLGHPQSLWSPSTWDPDLNINYPSVIDVPGSHAGKNGTSSSMKMELPSLQYSAASRGGGSWATSGCSPNASLESADPYIQSLLSEQTQSNFRSLGDCLMLDEMLLEHANAMAGRSRWEDRGSSHTQSAASAFVDNTPFSPSPGDEPQSAETVPGNIAEPETLDEILRHFYSHASAVTNRTKGEDLGSPLTHTPVSAFVNNTPFRASHGDEPQHTEHVPGNIANPYMAGWVSPEFDGQKDVMSQPENVRPDLLLDSLWFDTTTTNWRATGNRSTRW